MIDEALATDPALAPLVRHKPGLRSPGSVDGFETAVFAVLGQQISVRGACALAERLVAALGSPVEGISAAVAFPSPQAVLDGDLSGLGMTGRTQGAVRSIASLCVDGLSLDPGADRVQVRQQLLSVHGVGPWTADYVALRALRDPDVLPIGDLVVRRHAAALGLADDAGRLGRYGTRWAPWRTYATHHLWDYAPQLENTI